MTVITATTTAVTTTTVWKNSSGETALTELVTPYLDNCIAKVQREIAAGDTTKQPLLEALQAERAARTDDTAA